MKSVFAKSLGVAVALSAPIWTLSAETVAPVVAVPATVAPIIAAPSTIVPVVAMPRPTAETTGSALPANTEVWLSANSEVNSKRIKQCEKFDMNVTRDVLLGDYIVIPRGTRGIGQISYRTGKGAFGKSGKMEFDIVELELNGRQIPLRGNYRVEGQGNTGATVATAVAVGVFSAFVTGHSAIVSQNAEYRAFTSNSLPVVLGAATKISTAPVVDNKPEAFIIPDPKRKG